VTIIVLQNNFSTKMNCEKKKTHCNGVISTKKNTGGNAKLANFAGVKAY
jgi:hypothetical protein